MSGYYKTDNSSAFDEDGFLKTGDIGYYDDDRCIYILDRIKEMFKYKGWQISPSLIEAVLYEYPGVKEALVFGLPVNEQVGDIPTACLVLKDSVAGSEQEIQDFVTERVSDSEKLRGGVHFVSDLPKTPTGKIIRAEAKMEFLKKNLSNQS